MPSDQKGWQFDALQASRVAEQVIERIRPFIEKAEICGSIRFKNQFNDASFWLTMNGYIVLSVGSFLHSDNDPEIKDIILEHKTDLDVLHKEKIDMANSVMIIDVDNYIGESTASEILHANSRKKVIYSYRYSKLRNGRLESLVALPATYFINYYNGRKNGN